MKRCLIAHSTVDPSTDEHKTLMVNFSGLLTSSSSIINIKRCLIEHSTVDPSTDEHTNLGCQNPDWSYFEDSNVDGLYIDGQLF